MNSTFRANTVSICSSSIFLPTTKKKKRKYFTLWWKWYNSSWYWVEQCESSHVCWFEDIIDGYISLEYARMNVALEHMCIVWLFETMPQRIVFVYTSWTNNDISAPSKPDVVSLFSPNVHYNVCILTECCWDSFRPNRHTSSHACNLITRSNVPDLHLLGVDTVRRI
jgi:hypothetical protein